MNLSRFSKSGRRGRRLITAEYRDRVRLRSGDRVRLCSSERRTGIGLRLAGTQNDPSDPVDCFIVRLAGGRWRSSIAPLASRASAVRHDERLCDARVRLVCGGREALVACCGLACAVRCCDHAALLVVVGVGADRVHQLLRPADAFLGRYFLCRRADLDDVKRQRHRLLGRGAVGS